MTLPYLATTIRDPGLPKVQPTANVALVMGICLSGSTTLIQSFSSVADLVAACGYGPAVEAAAAVLSRGGGPVRVMRIAQSAAGAVVTSPLTETGGGTSPNVTDSSSTPYDAYDIVLTITTAGAVGTSRFTYSLDGGRTQSPPITTAATYTIPNTGVTLAFASGSYVAGETYATTTTAPIFTASELTAAMNVVRASQLGWNFGVLAGKWAASSDAQTMFAALSTSRGTLFEPFKNKPWLIDAGGSIPATAATALSGTDRWISLCYGTVAMSSACPIVGRSVPKLPLYIASACKAGSELISTHFGRVASGSLAGAAGWSTTYGSPLSHDEYITGGLDGYSIATARTVPGMSGYYITRQEMKSPVGSDFDQWHHARIFAEAHAAVYALEAAALNRSWSVKSNGTHVEDEAAAFEAMVEAALRALLHQPNAEGTLGHCSIDGTDPGFFYRLSRTQNVLATSQTVSEWGIRPRGYSEYITSTGGFTAQTV